MDDRRDTGAFVAHVLAHGRWGAACGDGKQIVVPTGRAPFDVPRIRRRRCGYLPSGIQSPKMVLPVGIDPATALSVATENLRQMDRALADAAERFGTRSKLMNHPIIGSLSVRQWRRFHWVHTRHHVRQIVYRAPPCGGRSLL
jgi:hypothetical protein